LATRQASIDTGDFSSMRDRLLTGMVIRLLEDKLGIVSDRQLRAEIMNEAMEMAASASGLTVEEMREQTAGGQTLAEIVEQNGGDLETLAADLEELFVTLPDAEEVDLQQATEEWLGMSDN
jgi:hypothetical protein